MLPQVWDRGRDFPDSPVYAVKGGKWLSMCRLQVDQKEVGSSLIFWLGKDALPAES